MQLGSPVSTCDETQNRVEYVVDKLYVKLLVNPCPSVNSGVYGITRDIDVAPFIIDCEAEPFGFELIDMSDKLHNSVIDDPVKTLYPYDGDDVVGNDASI